jgi:hypothetical protein
MLLLVLGFVFRKHHAIAVLEAANCCLIVAGKTASAVVAETAASGAVGVETECSAAGGAEDYGNSPPLAAVSVAVAASLVADIPVQLLQIRRAGPGRQLHHFSTSVSQLECSLAATAIERYVAVDGV